MINNSFWYIMNNISFQLKKVEQQNNLNINVFGWSDGSEKTGEPDREKSCFYPLRLSDSPNCPKAINLLLVGNEKTSHYVLISNMSGMLSARSKHCKKTYYCMR